MQKQVRMVRIRRLVSWATVGLALSPDPTGSSSRGALVKRVAGSAALGLAIAASVLSLVSAWVIPLGLIWPSVAWAVVGCVAGLWAIQVLSSSTRSMSDVIAGVEGESPPAVAARAKVEGPGTS